MSAREAVERALETLGDDPWHAFLHVDAEGARERARRVDPAAPLAGVVASVKDNLAWAGHPMTCGSRHLAGYVAPYSANVVERLERAGAVILGKTNMDEFAAGSSGENSAYGPTLNPRDITRVPGGSSAGAGASLAAGVVDVALGSDTGGSARCPAAFCGVAALKPTYGALSRQGLADLAMSLEGPAPMAKDVATLIRLHEALGGARVPEAPAESLRIGVPRELFEGLDEDVERPVRVTLARLAAKGARLVDVALPGLPHSLSAYYVLNYAEFASAMARYDGVRYGGTEAGDVPGARTFGPEVERRILLGTFVTSREERGRWYEAARKARAQLAREMAQALADVDVLMAPTMPTRAFRLGERADDPRAMYAADVLTVSANLARVPAGSVPLKVDGLPVGLQVLGREGDDARVLAAMRTVEAL
jgi:aspartyl-tRNA(Asn)/glutamyl-tRNA(Gln) amidotransferase subunit A